MPIMKCILLSIVGTICLSLTAAQFTTNVVGKVDLSNRPRRVSAGRVTPPSNGVTVLVADESGLAQVPFDLVQKHNAHVFSMPLEYHRQVVTDSTPYERAKKLKSKAHPAVILLIDENAFPGFAFYPEDAIAIINVGHYRIARESLFQKRLHTEIWRAFGFVLGGYAQPMGGCVLEPISTLDELDMLGDSKLHPIRLKAILNSARKLGIANNRPVPYEVACRRGFAPPPTNDIQRAIWERIKSDKERGPTNGIKIEPVRR